MNGEVSLQCIEVRLLYDECMPLVEFQLHLKSISGLVCVRFEKISCISLRESCIIYLKPIVIWTMNCDKCRSLIELGFDFFVLML